MGVEEFLKDRISRFSTRGSHKGDSKEFLKVSLLFVFPGSTTTISLTIYKQLVVLRVGDLSTGVEYLDRLLAAVAGDENLNKLICHSSQAAGIARVGSRCIDRNITKTTYSPFY